MCIRDSFDTIDPNSTDSDIAGIKNWFNEFFAKDTSRKIRAVNKAKGERGVPLTVNVPFGYRKDPEDKTKWVVDEAAALVVKRIFTLCMEGREMCIRDSCLYAAVMGGGIKLSAVFQMEFICNRFLFAFQSLFCNLP